MYHVKGTFALSIKRISAIRIAFKQALAACPVANQPHCRFAAVWQEFKHCYMYKCYNAIKADKSTGNIPISCQNVYHLAKAKCNPKRQLYGAAGV